MPILLVIHHPQLLKLVRLILMRRGYSVIEAHDGNGALVILEELHGVLAAVITDRQLFASMNGIELTLKIKQQFPGVPVLLMSGVPSEDHHATADCFLRKPFEPAELIESLRGLVAGPAQ
jgi:DNA-binding response OmpR family regulator